MDRVARGQAIVAELETMVLQELRYEDLGPAELSRRIGVYLSPSSNPDWIGAGILWHLLRKRRVVRRGRGVWGLP